MPEEPAEGATRNAIPTPSPDPAASADAPAPVPAQRQDPDTPDPDTPAPDEPPGDTRLAALVAADAPSPPTPDADPDPDTDTAPAADPDAAPAAPPDAPPVRHGWSPTALVVLIAATLVAAGAAVYHLGTVFLSIAPSNTLSQKYQKQINGHVLPEFEQNWQLFAPNPLQNNIHVQVQVRSLSANGQSLQSGWIDLTAQDIAAIHDDPAPSHTAQNLLRRAWDYYTSWHAQGTEAYTGSGADLGQEYLKRLALQRVGRDWQGRPITGVDFRSATTPLSGPAWTGAPLQPTTTYRVLPWWPVTPADSADLGLPS